jgi:hypothetical protein
LYQEPNIHRNGEKYMRKQFTQMSLFDTYADVKSKMEENKPEFLQMLEDHIDLDRLIPREFYSAFYKSTGRPREYQLESFIRFYILQKSLGITKDSVLLNVLRFSRELRDFCGFDKLPDASKITHFKQDFVNCLEVMFDNLVEITEPICREIDSKKADYLIYDPTGIEAYVAENNPKFLNTKLNQAKKMAKNNPNINPHALAYSLLPETAESNPFVKQQYINGHFCYAHKVGILTNGLGIVRDIAFFDEGFKQRHPEVVSKKTDNPELDKEIGDSTSLKPVLYDFFNVHPTFSYKTFLGDSSFDTYDTYTMLRNEFHFDRMAIPLNNRNKSKKHSDRDKNGTPVCPLDKTPFTLLGLSGGKNRSKRFKWVCHKSEKIPKTSKRRCTCETPCTTSSYGRCSYTYPDTDLRLYPGIPRATEHWDNLYRHRVLIERTINIIKDPLGAADHKSLSQRTAKADLLLAGITHLVGVVLAHAINKPHLYKSIRKLIA